MADANADVPDATADVADAIADVADAIADVADAIANVADVTEVPPDTAAVPQNAIVGQPNAKDGFSFAFGGALLGSAALKVRRSPRDFHASDPHRNLNESKLPMASPKKSASAAQPSFADLLSAVASPERWRIYLELSKGEPLPAGEIARRVGLTPNAASKLLLRLERSGLLERRYGKVYRIPPQFLVPGEAKLDFGPLVARLDYQHKSSA